MRGRWSRATQAGPSLCQLFHGQLTGVQVKQGPIVTWTEILCLFVIQHLLKQQLTDTSSTDEENFSVGTKNSHSQ